MRFLVLNKSDDFIANELYYGINYEREEFSLIKSITGKARTFVDVGANTGLFSLFGARANPVLQVYCFEPHPGNFRRLTANIELNTLKNIVPFQSAMGDKLTDLTFTIPADESIAATSSANTAFAANFHKIPHKGIKVKQTTLDTFAADSPIRDSDLIKIDVEYFELSVLHGARKLLTEVKPFILIEILPFDRLVQDRPEMKGQIDEDYGRKVDSFLQGFGYRCYELRADGTALVPNPEGASGRNFLYAACDWGQEVVRYEEILRTT